MDIPAYIDLFSSISLDWIIFGGCVLFFSFDVLRAGPARITALALALLLAASIVHEVPHTALLQSSVADFSDVLMVGIFIIFAIAFFMALYRMIDIGFESPNLVQAPIAGTAAAAIVMVVLLQLPESTWPWAVGDGFKAVFEETYRLFWIMGGIISLAIVRR